MQLRNLTLDFTIESALRFSKLLKELADELNITDENGAYRRSDSEFCLVWSQTFELLAQAHLARMHVINTTELAKSIDNELKGLLSQYKIKV